MKTIDFTYKVREFESKLKSFALSLTTDMDDAKDLLQETFLKALKYQDKFTADTNLGAWLFTIMKNTFINDFRKKKKQKAVIDNTKDSYYINSSTSTKVVTPDIELNYQLLIKLINGLEDVYKVPFKMHYEGFKYKEIAKELGLPIGTVKSRIFLARQKLMEQISKF